MPSSRPWRRGSAVRHARATTCPPCLPTLGRRPVEAGVGPVPRRSCRLLLVVPFVLGLSLLLLLVAFHSVAVPLKAIMLDLLSAGSAFGLLARRRNDADPLVHDRRVDVQPLRVIIAEDSALIREGLARLITDSGGVVVAKVGDGPSFVAAVVEHRPDVSVVDVRMPPSQRDEGLRAAIEARRRVPGTPVLVLSQYVERQYATELLADRAGGVGYLLKDRVADIREFMDALRRVARGGTALDPEVVAQLMVPRRSDDRLNALTPREREVLAAMAEGRTNMGIAALLSISEGATEKHISNIFGKLELPDSENDHRRVLAVLAYLGS